MLSAVNGALLSAYALPVGTVLPTNVKVTMASAQTALGASLALGSFGQVLNNQTSHVELSFTRREANIQSDVSTGTSKGVTQETCNGALNDMSSEAEEVSHIEAFTGDRGDIMDIDYAKEQGLSIE